MKRVAIAIVALVAALLLGGALVVRALVDPEHVREMIERQAADRLGQPVTIRRAALSWWPRAGVTLTDVVVGEPAALRLARVELSTAMRALLSRRIEDAELTVHDSELDLALVLAALERLRADAGTGASTPRTGPPATEEPSGGVTLVTVRAIRLENVRIRAGARSAVVNLTSSLQGDRLDVASASIASDVTTLAARGVMESLAGRKGRFSVTAESLDLDGLIVFAQAFAGQALPGAAAEPARGGGDAGPLDLVLDIAAARGDAADVPFEQLTATASVTPGRVAIAPLATRVFGGRLEGALRVNLSGPEPAYAIEGSLGGVDMARLTAFAGQPGSVTGTLSGSFTASGRGIDPAVALARAHGRGTATVSDGTISGLQLVRPIVLAFGRPDAAQPAEGGERFSRLSATYDLASGVVALSALAFESRDVEMDGTGTLRVEGRTLDITANARLSKALTAQAGRDLVRYTAEDGRVTVPVTITGPLEAPQVGVNIAGVAERALKNELRRRTQDAIRDLFKRKPPGR